MSPASSVPPKNSARLSRLALLPVAILLVLLARSLWLQRAEDALMKQTATRVVREAGAATPREKVLALRAYIRKSVTFRGAVKDRTRTSPLRDTASQILTSGKGFCGEDSRLFVCMARAAGVASQRLNLYGAIPHVCAEVELEPGNSLIVDCQTPATIPDLVRLDDLIATHRTGYTDYSTIFLERFGLSRVFRRIHLRMGTLGWWLESPHMIMAGIYGFLLALYLGTWLLLGALRAWALRTVRRAVLAPQGERGALRLQEADTVAASTQASHNPGEKARSIAPRGR
jgi:hypothetical protein